MSVFVTGASGFIGRALVERLARSRTAGAAAGAPIVGMSRDPGAAPPLPGVTWVQGDLLDPAFPRGPAAAALASAEVIVHLAAVRKDWALDDASLRRVNVESGPRLLGRAPRLRRFVLVSSVAVYGHPAGGPARESSPFRPSKRYGVSKVEAEAAMRAAAAARGVPLTIVRPGIVYGPRETYGMVANMARLIARRRFLLVGSGRNRVNLLQVDDLARALELTLTAEAAAGEDFILAGPEAVPMAGLARALARELEAPLPPLRVPTFAARLAAAVLEARARRVGSTGEPFITRAKVDILTCEDLYDPSKARERLGFTPELTLERGLPPTVAWLEGHWRHGGA